MSTLKECDDLVNEFWVAYRVFCAPGRSFTGADLLGFRQLPQKEQAYYKALIAPYEDPHAEARTQTVSSGPDENGIFTVAYDPPLPEACGCRRPVVMDHMRAAVRCSRCLHAWPWLERRFDENNYAAVLHEPIVGSVDRIDMGHAIERMGIGR